MKVCMRDIILERVMENLLHAQNIAADEGNVKGAITLSKHIVKFADKFGDKIIELDTVKCEQYPGTPPDIC